MPFLELNNSIECDMCANLKLPKTAAPGQAKAHIGAGGSACKLAQARNKSVLQTHT